MNKVLEMCIANTRIERDAAGNRKMNKAKATGRIDGAVALAMAVGVMPANTGVGDAESFNDYVMNPIGR
jgi:phage terminase large subunit-like protein